MPVTRNDRIHIAYTLTFKTPFHCGTGLRVGLIDRTVVRDSGHYLYVPGSTLKGVLREQCERLAGFFMDDEETVAQLRSNLHDERAGLLSRGDPLSLVTRIFGSQSVPGQLFFDDAHQSEEQRRLYSDQSRTEEEQEQERRAYRNLQVEVATQASIDRLTRIAVPGALYTSEFGTRNLVFDGTISGWLRCFPISDIPGQPTYSLLLLLVALNMLERIGSNKSSGRGLCECTITSVSYGSHRLTNAVDWQSWFDHLGSLSYYSLEDDLEGDVL